MVPSIARLDNAMQIVDGTKGVHTMIPKSYFVDDEPDYWYDP
jgi:hypothetical protein